MSKNHLKIVSTSDDELRVANYMVLFGGVDLDNEYFTNETEFESSYTKTGRLLVDWEHGLAEKGEPQRDDVLGYVDWTTATKDETGLWVERVLARRNEYMQYLESLIEADLVGSSSEAIPGKTKTLDTGEITVWPLRRDAITVTPAEPRMMTENVITAIKALTKANPHLEALLPQDTGEVSSADATARGVIETNNDKGEEIMDNEIDVQAAVDAAVKVALEKAEKAAAEKAAAEKAEQDKIDAAVAEAKEVWDAEQPPVNGDGKTQTKARVTKDDSEHDFGSDGEFFIAVKNAALYPGQTDRRLLPLEVKATGLSEGVPADGGYLLSPSVAGGLYERMYQDGQILSRCSSDPVGPNSNSILYNAVDETSRADGSRWGGLLGYWLAEAGTKTATKPAFRQMELKLKKVAVLCYATDEQLQDTVALESWLTRTVPQELRFQVENAIYRGNGVGKPLGIMNAPALVSVTRIDANQVDETDIANMWSRRWAGYNDYVWYSNSSVFPQLINLTIGNFPFLLPMNQGGQGDPGFSLYGRPYIEVEHTSALGTTGDIMLASMSAYQTIVKGGVQSASSIHVQFVTDETAFRFVYRIDGQPLWHSALTPKDAGSTLSPFVVLTAASV